MKHFSNQELLEISKRTPERVQETLSSEETINAITSIGAQFHLHIDQIGTLAELNVQMLLGLVAPQEFLQDLIAIGISDSDARQIMTEINEKIFIPLHERMKNMVSSSSTGVAEPLKSPRSSVPVPSYVPPTQNVSPPPQIPVPQNSIENEVVSAQSENSSPAIHNYIASLPPKTVMPGSQVSTPPTRDTSSVTEAQSPAMKKLVETPVNLPGAMPPRPAPAQVQSTPAPVRPPYSVDPYREPIE